MLSRVDERADRLFHQPSVFEGVGKSPFAADGLVGDEVPTRSCTSTSARFTTSVIRRWNTRTSPSLLEEPSQGRSPGPETAAGLGASDPEVTREIVEALRAFDDPIYLHQTIRAPRGPSFALSRFAGGAGGLGEEPDPLRVADPFPRAGISSRR